ncbi:alpha/beta hydrolase [Streptomyces sp. DSM 41524]|uniref:Alpha/beta hydrolase n=1 Tax=Streptomyces asiaticus subsp. ignotus TaxID=3098222 RepID=A0ABU7Q7D4_9ACTN|nr:alpha/beta hydrolase [Streptomyces sp. DSM 41524]
MTGTEWKTEKTEWDLDRTYLSSSGEVRWAEFGAPDAPPVVLLHGTPFSSYVWRGVARALAGRYRVFVWDMPGYGASEKRADQDVSLAAQGRVFGELLEEWGLTGEGADPAVVAHDFGGCVALRAHLLHGARYRRLALVNALAISPWGSPTYRLIGAHHDVFGQLSPEVHRGLVREYVRSGSASGLHPRVLERIVDGWCGDAEDQAAFYRQIAQNDRRFTDEIEGRYGEIRLPVLVCWGADDSWIPVERGRELASRIPGAGFRSIEGAGHLVQEDAPAELTAVLGGFLGEG